MSDAFYNVVRFFGRHPFWVSGRPVIIGVERTRRSGAYIVAANHESPFDVPFLIRHCQRNVDFVSTTEVFANQFLRWFYGNLNAFPLDRARADAPTVRTIFDRLHRGRVVGMFPEGGFRTGERSVIRSRQMRRGIGRIAKLNDAPIIPCAIINSGAYWRARSWLPLRRTRYGMNFGEPISPTGEPDEIERQFIDALIRLHTQLAAEMERA